MASTDTHPCPKCGRPVHAAGVLTINSVRLTTFVCEGCIMTVELLGERTEMPFTFALDPNGEPFDPTDPDGCLRLG